MRINNWKEVEMVQSSVDRSDVEENKQDILFVKRIMVGQQTYV